MLDIENDDCDILTIDTNINLNKKPSKTIIDSKDNNKIQLDNLNGVLNPNNNYDYSYNSKCKEYENNQCDIDPENNNFNINNKNEMTELISKKENKNQNEKKEINNDKRYFGAHYPMLIKNEEPIFTLGPDCKK